jgi:hypothetical protein
VGGRWQDGLGLFKAGGKVGCAAAAILAGPERLASPQNLSPAALPSNARTVQVDASAIEHDHEDF